ncbi:MAG: phosphodiester glycosidase family protein [Spirochaetota bacterium]|nr:phosphodiester glycosidase family protein [Spirochaetota bacterium]
MKQLICLLIIIPLFSCYNQYKHGEFVHLDNGFSYRYLKIKNPEYAVKESFSLFYIKIDPKKYRINLLTAKDLNTDSLYIREYCKLSNALLSINASFFYSKGPLGLQINNGKIISNLLRTKNGDLVDGGVFYIANHVPMIIHTKKFVYDTNISLAIQSRPRLVHLGKVLPRLKNQIARRSFIGITRDNYIVIGVTEDGEAYADDIGKILSMEESLGGVGCEYALNLDGGSSTQFYLNYKDFQKEIKGNQQVPNALAVFKK